MTRSAAVLATVATVFLIVLEAAPASFGNPMPPGTCTPYIDDGVAGVLHVRGDPNDGPQIVTMDIPANANRLVHGRATVDLSFFITTDGTVIAPKVLCTAPQTDGLAALILSAAPNWRFTPAMKDGKPIDSEAAYRIVFDRLRPSPQLIAFVPEN